VIDALLLFWLMFKAALFSTSGSGNLPILHQDLLARGWATDRNFAESLAIGQISPGPSGLWVISLGYLLDGLRGALLTVLKSGSASTLDVVRQVKESLPRVMKTLSADIDVKEFADQSIFVRAAIGDVVKEGMIAAALTAMMILLFLGSWRSTVIIALSIPLSVLSSLAILSALGETINLMTLGGMALAVGILVDDATVAIENIHRHMASGKELEAAIMDGAQEIALPAFVSTICICIVFVPMFFLTGVARYLFVPLAEAVVFAMLASYVISRTLVPTLVMWFYRNVDHYGEEDDHAPKAICLRPFAAINRTFETAFARFRAPWFLPW